MIPFEMLLLPHIPLRGRILSKSNSAGNSDCFCVCFHLHFNDRGIVAIEAIRLFAAGPGKGAKKSPATTSPLPSVNSTRSQESPTLGMKELFFLFCCPGRWGLSQKWVLGPFAGLCPGAALRHRCTGCLVLGKGMWCQRMRTWVLSIWDGWVLRLRVLLLLQELTAPAGGGEKGSQASPSAQSRIWAEISPVRAEPCPRNQHLSASPAALQMRYGDPGLPEKTAGSKDHWKRGNKLSVILLPGRPIELQRVPQGQLYIIISSHGSWVM